MEMHRLKILDDHICVLQNLEVMISEEIDNLTKERQRLAQNLGLTDDDGKGSVNDPLFPCTLCNVPFCAMGDDLRAKGSDRSGSPASVLEEDGVANDDDVGAVNDNHTVGVQLLGELSTPREAPCLDEADPDMNNLSDSEEERQSNASTYSVEPRMLTEMAGMSQGDDDKVPRSPSSLNNAESDSDVEEEDAAKPCWISNSIYTDNLINMVCSDKTQEFTSETLSFLKPGRIAEPFLSKEMEDTACLRSFHDWIVKKASATNRLTNDLERMKKELAVREDMIHLHWEKHRRYKAALREEIVNRQREADNLRNQRDQASSAKFLMFCKLQNAEERIDRMEKELNLLQSNEGITSQEEKERPPSDDVVQLDVRAQGRTRSHTPSFDFTPKAESVDCQTLQTSLKDAYKKLITAEKRGDELRVRLQQLEKQKKESVSTTSTGIKTKAGRVTKTAAVTIAARPGTEKKKRCPKLDLSRVSRQPVQKEAALVRGASRLRQERERPASRATRSKRW